MEVDPDVIAALERVVDREPEHVSLTLHLAALLLHAGRPADALHRARAVLAAAPADPTALELEDRALGALRAGRPGLRLVD